LGQSDEVIQTAVASIKQEWKKSKKNHDNIKEHMKTTYSKRRAMVVHDMKPIMEIVEMFPPLQTILYVSIVYLCLVNNLSLMFKVAVISVVFKGGWYLSRVILTP
jgi:thiosulfate reductase cytochrome b subunit